MLTLPIPWLLEYRLSLAPEPFIYEALFIIIAFVMAGLGTGNDLFIKFCRINAPNPAVAGVEWLVPELAVVHCWPAGKKLLPPVPPQTPLPVKQAFAVPVP